MVHPTKKNMKANANSGRVPNVGEDESMLLFSVLSGNFVIGKTVGDEGSAIGEEN